MIEVTHQFGMTSFRFQFDTDDPKDVVKALGFWTELPDTCPLCESHVGFFHREAKSFNFYGLRCNGPEPHETQFGQYKAGGLYYKGEWAKRGGQEGDEGSGGGSGQKEAAPQVACAWDGCSATVTPGQVALCDNKKPDPWPRMCLTHQKEYEKQLKAVAAPAPEAAPAPTPAPAPAAPPAPKAPPAPAAAPPPPKPVKPPTKDELDTAIQWVDYVASEEVALATADEAAAWRAELADKATLSRERCLEIYGICNDRHAKAAQ